ncbi:hypothetical protein N0V90_008856 [Kalmusia sp. IMI 367209]|nr:hypothetical protein N0V90_008856 [Kalmusia sp. IMI 367209]
MASFTSTTTTKKAKQPFALLRKTYQNIWNDNLATAGTKKSLNIRIMCWLNAVEEETPFEMVAFFVDAGRYCAETKQLTHYNGNVMPQEDLVSASIVFLKPAEEKCLNVKYDGQGLLNFVGGPSEWLYYFGPQIGEQVQMAGEEHGAEEEDPFGDDFEEDSFRMKHEEDLFADFDGGPAKSFSYQPSSEKTGTPGSDASSDPSFKCVIAVAHDRTMSNLQTFGSCFGNRALREQSTLSSADLKFSKQSIPQPFLSSGLPSSDTFVQFDLEQHAELEEAINERKQGSGIAWRIKNRPRTPGIRDPTATVRAAHANLRGAGLLPPTPASRQVTEWTSTSTIIPTCVLHSKPNFDSNSRSTFKSAPESTSEQALESIPPHTLSHVGHLLPHSSLMYSHFSIKKGQPVHTKVIGPLQPRPVAKHPRPSIGDGMIQDVHPEVLTQRNIAAVHFAEANPQGAIMYKRGWIDCDRRQTLELKRRANGQIVIGHVEDVEKAEHKSRAQRAFGGLKKFFWR